MKRRKQLQRKTELKSGEPLKRTTPLRQVSKKRDRELKQRRKVIAEVMATRYRCEAIHLIKQSEEAKGHRCGGWAVDIHEPLTRARGGSITDPANMVPVCRACHDWIHHHPKEATTVGLLRSAPPKTDPQNTW